MIHNTPRTDFAGIGYATSRLAVEAALEQWMGPKIHREYCQVEIFGMFTPEHTGGWAFDTAEYGMTHEDVYYIARSMVNTPLE